MSKKKIGNEKNIDLGSIRRTKRGLYPLSFNKCRDHVSSSENVVPSAISICSEQFRSIPRLEAGEILMINPILNSLVNATEARPVGWPKMLSRDRNPLSKISNLPLVIDTSRKQGFLIAVDHWQFDKTKFYACYWRCKMRVLFKNSNHWFFVILMSALLTRLSDVVIKSDLNKVSSHFLVQWIYHTW